MLELDKLLEGFFKDHYASLTDQQKQDFIDLLACADQDLYNWLMKESEPEDARFRSLCEIIRHEYQA
jgi:antitoxin CptB